MYRYWLSILCILFWLQYSSGQDGTEISYARTLQKKYPSVKSDFCTSCKYWENPYFKSIADTLAHTPLVTYYIYTREHRLMQEALGIDRKGVAAAWLPSFGQVDETKIYKSANKESPDVIAKGHCQPWILLAWGLDAAILSNTYTFNAAMEYQGQNIGTQIETEELCRELTGYKGEMVTDSVRIWCGTARVAKTFKLGDVSVTMPGVYYKIITYCDHRTSRKVTRCFWMPNLPTETRDKLPGCELPFEALVTKLGYDPTILLN